MSNLEWATLSLALALWLAANFAATWRAWRRLGRYCLAYVLVIWLLPIFGALMIWVRLAAVPKNYLALAGDTLSTQGPATLQDCSTLTNIKPLHKRS